MTLDSAFWLVGVCTCAVGGALVAGIIAVRLFELLADAWMDFSIKFRAIFKAEKLILDFKRNRDDFLEWKKEREEYKNGN